MNWTLLFLSVLGWIVANYTPHGWVVIFPFLIGGWFFFKAKPLLNWWTGIGLFFLVAQVVFLVSPFQSNALYVVRERRATWMMVDHRFQRYYVQINPEADIDVGDLITLAGTVHDLQMTTYESRFNFKDYLTSRGMHQEIKVVTMTTVFRFPWRTSGIIDQRLQGLDPGVRDAVSQWLWNRRQPTSTLSAWVEQMLGVSGLGFYALWKFFQRMGSWFAPTPHVMTMLLFIFFPLMLINLHQWGIWRIYLINVIHRCLPQTTGHQRRMIVLSFLSMVNPYLWFQSGGQLYLVYQIWLGVIKPMFYRIRWYQQSLAMIGIALGWSWVTQGMVLVSHAITYAPLTMLQTLVVPGWLIYLYTGWLMPGLSLLSKGLVIGFQAIPNLAPIYLGTLPWYTLILFWLLIGLWLWSYVLRLSVYRRGLTLTFFMLCLMHLSGLDRRVVNEVHFLNVGQGDATLVMSQGQSLLIDTGGVLAFDISETVLIPYFKKLRMTHLDYLIITHDDFDHNGGLATLTRHFSVGQVIDQPFPSFRIGQWTITNYQYFLSVLEEDNERSLMIGIEQSTCRWLIMGDATVKTESYFMQYFPTITATILRIGHHGSLTSTSARLLDQLQPKHAVISSGGGNRYGHPHPEVLQRLQERNIRIRRTDLEGTIRYQTCKIGL